MFQKEFRNEDTVFKLVVDTIRLMLMGLKIKRSVEVEKAAVIWHMSMKGMSMVDTRRSLNGVIDGIT